MTVKIKTMKTSNNQKVEELLKIRENYRRCWENYEAVFYEYG